MDCTDNYTHNIPQLMYFPQSIPSREVENTVRATNLSCTCEKLCNENCECRNKSGTFYEFIDINNLESYKITFKNVNKPTYECNEYCKCLNKLCGNKLIQSGPRSGLEVKICNLNPIKGFGLFTKNVIEQGNFICEYAGEILSENEASIRFKINAKNKSMNYIFCIDEYFGNRNLKTFIDPTYYGNIGRYVNHSCEPNCVMIISRINNNIPILALFASRDISINEELNYDYGISVDLSKVAINEANNRTKCLCGSKNCKNFLPYDTTIM